MAAQTAELAAKPREPIVITLPDGRTVDGVSHETTPLKIAESISKGLAQNVVVAKLTFTGPVERDNLVNTGPDDEEDGVRKGELWDLTRPLPGSCALQLLTFDDKEGKMVFWHSSAHMLGECLECAYGCHLCVGPPVDGGFYYDAYMGQNTVNDSEFKGLQEKVSKVSKAKQAFTRIVLTKQEALEMFRHNPFKTQIIQTKIPDGKCTTAYRCGPLIDLCTGPHVPHTGRVKAFHVARSSNAYWLGQQDNDSLQRVYGVSFPEKAMLTEWKTLQKEAEKRDHRRLGMAQELFFFHQLSPGSAFFLPHGARLYNKLQDFIKREYWLRGYEEVITPNVFKLDLWHTSGHAKHYKDAMFCFDCDEGEYGLKPMNCPGHCLLFDHRVRSYRELPLRLADFGVLHRNELSGALTGLTRVRRFCQDDAHIFCREDQITAEVLGALKFMERVYGIFGMTFKLELSTRPAKALGKMALWDVAEGALADALNEFAGPGAWRENPGDGAFYGPKIDIKVHDALKRVHQCATIQLDFQLPIRFNLKYRASDEVKEVKDGAAAAAAAAAATEAEDEGEALGDQYKRPIIVHRAMLGSLERMIAILTEHYGGKWPFWLSPRQAVVVPVGKAFVEYAQSIRSALHTAGFYCDVDESSKTFNKKVREAQLAQYNYILIVGEQEATSNTMSVRTRDNKVHKDKYTKEQIIDIFRAHTQNHE